MKPAWSGTNHTLESPGVVEQWYFEDEGLVVVDLEPDRQQEGPYGD
jgi:hypothetical protein